MSRNSHASRREKTAIPSRKYNHRATTNSPPTTAEPAKQMKASSKSLPIAHPVHKSLPPGEASAR